MWMNDITQTNCPRPWIKCWVFLLWIELFQHRVLALGFLTKIKNIDWHLSRRKFGKSDARVHHKCNFSDRNKSLGMQSLLRKERVPERSPGFNKVMPVRDHWQKWLPFVHFVFKTRMFLAHFSLFSQSSRKLLLSLCEHWQDTLDDCG